jgi:hypothetical protein
VRAERGAGVGLFVGEVLLDALANGRLDDPLGEGFGRRLRRGPIVRMVVNGVVTRVPAWYNFSMSTLPEIEAAVESLTPQDKQQLLLFLAARLRAQSGSMPPVRRFTREQISGWIDEDDEEMRRLRDADLK